MPTTSMSREVLHRGAKHHAPDAAEAVDADLDGHANCSWMSKNRSDVQRLQQRRCDRRDDVLRREPEMLEQHAGAGADSP